MSIPGVRNTPLVSLWLETQEDRNAEAMFSKMDQPNDRYEHSPTTCGDEVPAQVPRGAGEGQTAWSSLTA